MAGLLAQQLINGLLLGGIYVLVAVALTLTMGVLNFLNFSIPGIFMLGGMVTWGFLDMGWTWMLAAAGGLVVATLGSLLVERFTYRAMRSSEHFVPLVSSMGFLILFENLVLVQWGSDQQTFPWPYAEANLRVAGLIIGVPQLVSLAVAVGLVVGLHVILKRTRLGRGLRAIAEDSDTAIILGVEVQRIVIVVFLVTGLFTGLGGLLFAVNYLQVSPFMGEEVALKGIAAMVLGGMGNIWGAIVGGLLIGVTEIFAIHFFGADMVDIAVYGLLLLLLIVRPTGLFGKATLGKGKL